MRVLLNFKIILLRLFTCILLVCVFVFSLNSAIFAFELDGIALVCDAPKPVVSAEAAIVADITNEKIIFSKNELKRMYPASTTKILTCLVALDYIKPDEMLIVGQEVNSLPLDASTTKHKIGESILFENAIRALLMASGNDTSCVIAMEVAKRESQNPDIKYSNAERLFCSLMNKKALEVGASSSNFVNPHGYHSSSHFTTAYDLLMISKAAMANSVFAKISVENSFEGNGAGLTAEEVLTSPMLTQNYSWNSSNLLLSGDDFGYEFATGIRTGMTDEAGSCLSASSKIENRQFICILLNSEDENRWTDAAALFDYANDNFSLMSVQESNQKIGEIKAKNVPLGENEIISYYTTSNFSMYMSEKMRADISSVVSFNKELIYTPEDGEIPDADYLVPPINLGDVIGKVSYVINDETIFVDDIVSGNTVTVRTFNTDVEYRIQNLKNLFFSMSALPYWIIFILVTGIIIYISFRIKKKFNNKNKGYKLKIK